MLGLGTSVTSIESYHALETGYTSLVGNTNGPAFNTNYKTDAPFNSNFTISFWLKMTDGQSGNDFGTASKTYLVYGGDASNYMQFIINSTGLPMILGQENGGPVGVLASGQNPSDGANDWAHWVITCVGGGGSNTVYAIFKNGNAATMTHLATSDSTKHAAMDNGFGLGIGSSRVVSTGMYMPEFGIRSDEWIDDFAVHSAVLDADAITAVYNSGTPINLLANSGDYDNSGDLVLYYKFNGSSQQAETTDSHGTSNGIGGSFSTTESAT
jgi:hypothetical protein